MAITKRSQDKYAFLFTGPTGVNRFIKDIENVFQTLTEYYNYPANHITVVRGSATAAPSVPGATVIDITTEGELRVALDSFAGMASGPAPGLLPPDNQNTALLYFTGGGITETSVSKLVIDDGTGTNNIDPTWLTTRLNNFSDCHVNVLMQQAYSGGFLSALTGSTLTQWSFTSSCDAAQDSYGNNTLGSFFTYGWIKGLKFETLPAGTPNMGKYADQLGSVGEDSNRLISFAEAKEFGKQIHDAMGFGSFSTPGCTESGGSQYPGLPDFLIRDGSPSWWESPDIFLTHPNHPSLPPGDLYIPDPLSDVTAPWNNRINIIVRNVGTHPVRAYSLGIALFRSGLSPGIVQHTASDIIPSGGILFPIDTTDISTDDQSNTYQWDTPFYETATHSCVRAEAKLLAGDLDWAWSVFSNDFEGQRNIDEMTVVPTSLPLKTVDLPDLLGFNEHIYAIENPLDTARKFLMVLPDTFLKHQDIIELNWFLLIGGPLGERVPLVVKDEPVPHIPFSLKAGEKRDILLQARMKPGFALDEGIKLPIEIEVEGDWPENARAIRGDIQLPNYAPIAGFTVTIKKGSSTLKGTVLDKENKPAANTKIFLRTANELQGAVITTDKKGRFTLKDITPTVYHLRAETDTWQSKEQTIVLLNGDEKQTELVLDTKPFGGRRVKVILEKIRILDDRDPCIVGKGELKFTSVVVPDYNHAKKRVTRLPAKGVYRVSDKPGKNEIRLEATLFDGMVRNRSLSITISGKEIDHYKPDDKLNRYRRVFAGDPAKWYGSYQPDDEYRDPEKLDQWLLWYRIVEE